MDELWTSETCLLYLFYVQLSDKIQLLFLSDNFIQLLHIFLVSVNVIVVVFIVT